MRRLKQFAQRLIGNSLTAKEHSVTLITLYSLGLLTFALALFLVQRIPGDDLIFQEQIKPFATLPEWVTHRYETWSGRIFAESFVYIFSPLPLIFWKLASLILYALYSGFLFKYYTLFAKKRTHLKDCVMLVLALALPLLMDIHVLKVGMLWVTGSMNYFWIAVFGLIGFYPFCHYAIQRTLPHWTLRILSVVCIAIAASSQEQVGATLTVLLILFTGYIMHKNKWRKVPIYLIAMTILSITLFALTINAPGNQLRLETETIRHLPDFYTVPLMERIEYSYRWFIDSIINHFGLLLVIYWALLLGLFYHKKQQSRLDKIDYAVIAILGTSLIVLTLKGFNSVSYWFNFYPTWKSAAPSISFAILLPWTVAIITSIVAPIVLLRRKILGLLIAILFCATLATTAIITLSPTMYVSGLRTLYVPCILLIITIYILFDRFFDAQKKLAATALAVILTVSTSQYLQVIQNAIQ